MKLYRIRVIYEGEKNFQFFHEAEDAKEAIKDIMELPRVREATMKYNLLDVQIEELDKLPVPAEDRFWLERRDDDGIYMSSLMTYAKWSLHSRSRNTLRPVNLLILRGMKCHHPLQNLTSF